MSSIYVGLSDHVCPLRVCMQITDALHQGKINPDEAEKKLFMEVAKARIQVRRLCVLLPVCVIACV